MHGFTDRVIAAKRERNIRQATRCQHMRAGISDFPARLNKIDGVVVVLLNTCRHREDIGVKNNVLGREAHDLG